METRDGLGAPIVMRLEGQFWGDRYGVLADKWGNRRGIAHKEDVSPAEIRKRGEEALKKMKSP